MIFYFSGKLLTVVLVYNALLTLRIEAGKLKYPRAKFTLNSVRDSVLPAIQPLFSAGSKGCDSIKNFFGLTYNQMQAKNTSLNESVNIDLITKNGNVKYDLKNNKQMKRAVHDSERIFVLIHGFMESSEGEMVQAISSELLKHPRWKIFALDGRKTIKMEYLRASTYTRFMGELLGTFLSELIEEGQDPSKIFLVGHSLGAHIAGIAGNQVYNLTGKQIGRITGLDPAGPCFSNATLVDKLDKTDAVYVDIIHTNGGILGLKEPLGHKDFYPNGGTSQAGCYFYICDHSRAWEFYAESVNTPNAFPAKKCDNWAYFLRDRCKETTHMGIGSQSGSDGIYYLITKSSKPFGYELEQMPSRNKGTFDVFLL